MNWKGRSSEETRDNENPKSINLKPSYNLSRKAVPQINSSNRGSTTQKFQAKHIDFAKEALDKKRLGDLGELLVLENEKECLKKLGRNDLARKIIHTSSLQGDGAGYDILSYTPESEIKYIEVKTTTGAKYSTFEITANELAFSIVHSNNYKLVRVYNLDTKNHRADYFEIEGRFEQLLKLSPVAYKATL